MPIQPPVMLVICDGLGYSEATAFNAVVHAQTPFFDTLWARYPHTLLNASGAFVGLPDNNPGNSEAGHLAIGTGRIIPQPSSFVLNAIKSGEFALNKKLIDGLKAVHKASNRLHIMGLLSDAGIHSHEDILYAVINTALQQNIAHIYIHVFLDGRDTPPQSAVSFMQKIEAFIKKHPTVSIASLCGRFYSMDRDNHWNRTEQVYRMLTEQQPHVFANWKTVLDHYYAQQITDEHIPPTQLDPAGIIKPNDGVFFFNIRPDRARQLTTALTDSAFNHFTRTVLPLSCFITPIPYHKDLMHYALYQEPIIPNTLSDILLAHGKTIFAIAETEKYAHVSYFFNGRRESTKDHETRILVPSLPLSTYETSPCMSAPAITQQVLASAHNTMHDFYVINYANADMVGHSGNFNATIKAIECLDTQIGKLYTTVVKELGGTLIITGDHGKAEEMFDIKSNQPKKAHTINKVPYIEVIPHKQALNHMQSLTDIAPRILTLFGIAIPLEME